MTFYEALAEFLAWIVDAEEFLPPNEGAKRCIDILIAMQGSLLEKEQSENERTKNLL